MSGACSKVKASTVDSDEVGMPRSIEISTKRCPHCNTPILSLCSDPAWIDPLSSSTSQRATEGPASDRLVWVQLLQHFHRRQGKDREEKFRRRRGVRELVSATYIADCLAETEELIIL
jgi:uncharacterized protein with PIN domain